MERLLRTLGHWLVLAALPWVLVSHVTMQQCVHEACPDAPAMPLSNTRTLGEYATQERCEAVAAALTERWQALEREAEAHPSTPPPTDGELRLVTTFRCEPHERAAPPAGAPEAR
jgi:hypothetical protein